jgi:hypothetical protein
VVRNNNTALVITKEEQEKTPIHPDGPPYHRWRERLQLRALGELLRHETRECVRVGLLLLGLSLGRLEGR